jgi:hypothetical protein
MVVQRFHPALRIGQPLTLSASGNALFSRQGHWDGGSALHCVAMALAMLGKLADPVYPPYHAHGNERVLWDHAWPHYLHGLTLSELSSFIFELNLDVRPTVCSGAPPKLIGFTTRELRAALQSSSAGVNGIQSNGTPRSSSVLKADKSIVRSRHTPCCCSIRPATHRHGRTLMLG